MSWLTLSILSSVGRQTARSNMMTAFFLLFLVVLTSRVDAASNDSKECMVWACTCTTRNVDCNKRNLTSLENADWPDMEPETHLVLSYNNLSELNATSFSGATLKHVHSLDLSNNVIGRLEDDTFANFSSVRNLDLKHNKLRELSAHALSGLSLLERLDLSYNRLNNLSNSVLTSCRGLRNLVLRYNPLLQVDAALLSPVPDLEILDLHNVGLEHLPENLFVNTSDLTSLDIASNKFESVPTEALFPLQTLVRLIIGDNPIRRIPARAFDGLYDLEELSLDTMENLVRIDAYAFDGLKNLRLFSCSYNRRLTSIDGDAFRSVDSSEETIRPKEVRLRQNALTHLSQKLLPWMYVDTIDLQENPWNCDCNLQWMQKIVAKKDPSDHEVRCESPPQLSGRRIEDVAAVNFICNEEHAHALLSIVLFLIVFVVVVGVMAAISCWKMRACAKCREAYQQRYKKLSTSGREAERVEMDCSRGGSRDVEV